jgi:hypothetical protein
MYPLVAICIVANLGCRSTCADRRASNRDDLPCTADRFAGRTNCDPVLTSYGQPTVLTSGPIVGTTPFPGTVRPDNELPMPQTIPPTRLPIGAGYEASLPK